VSIYLTYLSIYHTYLSIILIYLSYLSIYRWPYVYEVLIYQWTSILAVLASTGSINLQNKLDRDIDRDIVRDRERERDREIEERYRFHSYAFGKEHIPHNQINPSKGIYASIYLSINYLYLSNYIY
jgi:hypothetical protein